MALYATQVGSTEAPASYILSSSWYTSINPSIFQQYLESTAKYSSKPPSIVMPISSRLTHWLGNPLRQGVQCPHQFISSTVTGSPTLRPLTFFPTSWITPDNSWPRTDGNFARPG